MIEPDVNLVICLASGFGVRAYARSDVRAIYRRLRTSYISSETELHYDVWNGGWSDTAERLHQIATRNARCIFIAHSWGCGHGYKVFEKTWGKCGRCVDLAVLIDPVPRPFRFFIPGNVWALTTWGKVKVHNAREAMAFRQVNARPMGRRVVDGKSVTITRTAFGSEKNLEKYASRAIGEGRVVDGKLHHNSIDGDPRVTEMIFTAIHSKYEAWRHGR